MMANFCGQIDQVYYNTMVVTSALFVSNLLSCLVVMPSFSSPRVPVIQRIGPHIKEALDIIVCGMLGD